MWQRKWVFSVCVLDYSDGGEGSGRLVFKGFHVQNVTCMNGHTFFHGKRITWMRVHGKNFKCGCRDNRGSYTYTLFLSNKVVSVVMSTRSWYFFHYIVILGGHRECILAACLAFRRRTLCDEWLPKGFMFRCKEKSVKYLSSSFSKSISVNRSPDMDWEMVSFFGWVCYK